MTPCKRPAATGSPKIAAAAPRKITEPPAATEPAKTSLADLRATTKDLLVELGLESLQGAPFYEKRSRMQIDVNYQGRGYQVWGKANGQGDKTAETAVYIRFYQ